MNDEQEQRAEQILSQTWGDLDDMIFHEVEYSVSER